METLHANHSGVVKFGREKWLVGRVSEHRKGYPYSPLSVDADGFIRVICGLQKTNLAISELVSMSMRQWKRPESYRKFLLVVGRDLCAFAVPPHIV